MSEHSEIVVFKLADIIEKQQNILKLCHLTMKSMLRNVDHPELQESYALTLQSMDNTIETLEEMVQPILGIVKGTQDD